MVGSVVGNRTNFSTLLTWSGTEADATGLTRNQFVWQPARLKLLRFIRRSFYLVGNWSVIDNKRRMIMATISDGKLSTSNNIYIPPINDSLKKAVAEYYEWNGDKSCHPVKFVVNKMPGKYKMLLVRFTDKDKNKMSSLMDYQTWADGHWDVTEVDAVPRECEKCMVNEFENSEEYL
jgi:hypothetical protein